MSLNYDSATGNIKSAPAKHAHDNQHLVDFNSVQVLTTASNRHCLNLLEHASIVTLDPPLNRQHAGLESTHVGRHSSPLLRDHLTSPVLLQIL